MLIKHYGSALIVSRLQDEPQVLLQIVRFTENIECISNKCGYIDCRCEANASHLSYGFVLMFLLLSFVNSKSRYKATQLDSVVSEIMNSLG